MSEILSQVIERASTDAAFRAALASNPDRALAEYSLSSAERATLLRAVPHAMAASGVDVRMSKLDNHAEPGDTYPDDPWH
jgi:hypothetical protein